MPTHRGWVYKIRKHKSLIFIDLRTQDGILQCVINQEKVSQDTWNTALSLTQESSIEVDGEYKEEPRAPGGKELHIRSLKIYHIAETPYPLGKKEQPPDVILMYRDLALRSPRYQAIMKVRASVIEGFRKYLNSHGWIEVSPPIINFTACEGGATLFKIKYFDQDAYLSQSAQLYLEMMCPSLFKVWSLTPSFRAEKSRTRRHLAEFWHLEIEAAWLDMDGLMDVEEEMVKSAITHVLENNERELVALGINRTMLEKFITGRFERITYTKAIEILQSKGIQISWGSDLGADEEKVLTSEIERPMFVKDYPAKIKPFYVKLTGVNK
ncbi:MAG: asparagine--tRNA ligase, partial [Candidatus Methanomethylicaceae archaeon]